MLLALDTSTLTLSLCLAERDSHDVLRERGARIHGPPHKQSELLPGAVGELLQQHGVALRELEGIAVGLGPGSFTGLRIGLSTVKALAYACELKVAGVSSLAAVALDGPEGVPLLSTAVARQGELYVGEFRHRDGKLEVLTPETAMTPVELAQRLAATPDALALGPSIAAYRAELEQHGVAATRLLDEPSYPRAFAIARLATLPERYDAQALFALEPHYVRASEAERNPKFPPLPGPPPTARIRHD